MLWLGGILSPRVTVRKILVAEDKEAPNVEISNWLHDVRNSGLDEEQGLPDIQCGHSGLRAPHERTLTDKERAYQLEIRGKEKREFETKLRKHIGIIYALFDSRVGHEVLDKVSQKFLLSMFYSQKNPIIYLCFFGCRYLIVSFHYLKFIRSIVCNYLWS